VAPLPRRLSLLGALALTLAACSSSATASPTAAASRSASPTAAPSASPVKAPRTLVTAGSLTFLSDTINPPQESIDPTTNQAVGLDVDIASAIAGRMGLSTTILPTDYASLVRSLLDHKGDAAISGMTITPDLQRSVAFVGYFQAAESILVRKGNPDGILKPADLCGKRVGVQVTTSEQDTLTSENGGDCAARHIDIRTFATDTVAVQTLRDGGLEAVLDDSPVAVTFVNGNPDSLELAGSPLRLGIEGIAVDPRNQDVLSAIQRAMLAIAGDGTYRQILRKWGLESLELPTSQIVVSPSPSSGP
jgi:polar amino acid transport system substrate-binding protein